MECPSRKVQHPVFEKDHSSLPQPEACVSALFTAQSIVKSTATCLDLTPTLRVVLLARVTNLNLNRSGSDNLSAMQL